MATVIIYTAERWQVFNRVDEYRYAASMRLWSTAFSFDNVHVSLRCERWTIA